MKTVVTVDALENEQYFFHPDHLGSSNYITNFVGEVSQHMEYFAFGETFIEEHKNSNNSPYKFNGKELDEESSLYYYGARYYDPRISIWASTDPLAEKGPEYSPYCYTFNNPINLVDSDGRWPNPSWFTRYTRATWAASANLVIGAFTGTYNGVRNGINATKSVVSSYRAGGVKAAASEYVNQVYITSGAKSAVETLQKATTGNPEAIAKTVVNVAAIALIHQISKGSAVSTSASESSIINNLSNSVKTTAAELSSSGRAPATVVGAELNGQTAISTSGAPPTIIAPQLEGVISDLGGLGNKTSSGNAVGCCAEFHVGNKLLLENPSSVANEVNFTNAIRPRTGQIVPMCENCKTTFGK